VQGHFFGETSLVKDEPRNANVKVKSSTAVVMSIGKDVFYPFMDKEPGFRRFIGLCVYQCVGVHVVLVVTAYGIVFLACSRCLILFWSEIPSSRITHVDVSLCLRRHRYYIKS
jgi:hypothetical protein